MSTIQIGRFSKQGDGALPNPRGTELLSLAVAQVEAPGVEVSRAGLRFVASGGVIANGAAPVQDVPTTTATWMLWNGDANKSYCIDYISYFLASGTGAVGSSLLLGLTLAAQAAPAAATGWTVGTMSGSSIKSKAVVGAAITLTGGTPTWFTGISSYQAAGAGVGTGDQPYVPQGSLIVPPGYGLGIAILSGAGTTPKFMPSIIWSELALDSE